MRHGTHRGASAELQPLEQRRLLNGNVRAILSSGSLILRGNAADNSVVITRQSNGNLLIEGRDSTTINNNGESAELGPVTQNLTVQMTQGGEDFISVQGELTIPGDVTAEIDEGEFLIEGSAGALHIEGDLEIVTGEEGIANVRNEVVVDGSTSIESEGDAYIVTAGAIVPDFDDAEFSDSLTIDNPYFPVVPGAVYEYHARGVDDDTDETFTERIVVTMTSETLTVNGVQVRVVNDKVYEDDLLIEDTDDWYAQDDDGNVWYFGEFVVNYEYDDDGEVISTDNDGSWTAGEDGAQAGINMEAKPRVGHRYYQEFSPGSVLDVGMGLATQIKVKVPVGTYRNVFRVEETTVAEPFALGQKQYAPGVGMVSECDLDIEDNEIVQSAKLITLTLNREDVTAVVSPTGFTGTNVGGRLVGGAELNGAASIESEEGIVINGAVFGNEVTIDAESEAILVSSEFAAGAEIAGGEAVTLRDVFASGSVSIRGRADVFVFGSQIDRLALRMSESGNDLTIRDSVIDRLDAYGGGGHNRYFDQGGNDIDSIRIRKFSIV